MKTTVLRIARGFSCVSPCNGAILFTLMFLNGCGTRNCGQVACWSESIKGLQPDFIREAEWEEVRDWMASDGYFWLEEQRYKDGMFWVGFSSFCGSVYDVLAIRCQNTSDKILDVKKFPERGAFLPVVGVDMDGPFDLSHTSLDDKIKYFHWENFSSDCACDYSKVLPLFGAESMLEVVEISFCNASKFKHAEHAPPILDLRSLSNLHGLRVLDVGVDCPVSGLDSVLAKESLRYLKLRMVSNIYDYWEVDAILDYEDNLEKSGWAAYENKSSIYVSDQTFDELAQLDLSKATEISIQINLSPPKTMSQARHFSIANLMNTEGAQKLRWITIKASNCFIDNLDSAGDFGNVACVDVDMDIELGPASRASTASRTPPNGHTTPSEAGRAR